MNDIAPEATSTYNEPLDAEDQVLFGGAYDEHRAALVQHLRRRVANDADAEDIAQEAYLRVLRYRRNQNLGSIKALLYRIGMNLIFARGRASKVSRLADHASLDDLDLPSAAPSHEQHLTDQQHLAALLHVIRSLPDKCRHVFVLSRFEGMSNPEIAARCGISVRMVEKQISKALAACRARVRPDDL